MEIVSLRPELHLTKPAFGQSYLWRDGSELTLVDTGIPGSGVDLAAAFAELGFHRRRFELLAAARSRRSCATGRVGFLSSGR
jgi:hypothetical protein